MMVSSFEKAIINLRNSNGKFYRIETRSKLNLNRVHINRVIEIIKKQEEVIDAMLVVNESNPKDDFVIINYKLK